MDKKMKKDRIFVICNEKVIYSEGEDFDMEEIKEIIEDFVNDSSNIDLSTLKVVIGQEFSPTF
ncbi:MAG: hypothetical protein ACOC2W_02390, partial [bacterium]